MKLRHRRGTTNGNVGPILPLTMDGASNTPIITRNRRRRKNSHSETIMKSAACCFVACLLSLALIVYLATIAFPEQHHRSYAHKVLPKVASRKVKLWDPKKTITCADGTSLGLLNDDYCDCDDGRDEPNTSACSNILVQKLTFRCDNKDGSIMIHASKVNDGVDDCPDQSDERNS